MMIVYLTLCTGAFAQTTQSITGLVTDQTGAVIQKAKVTVHNQGTGVDKLAITTSTGNWTVPFLDPGVYDVRVEADKFTSVDKTNITLQTGRIVAVNFTLTPGNVTESVTVNASADVLDYVKADRGMVIENESVEQLPVFDGNTFNLAYLSPGFMSTTTGTAPGNQSAQTYGIHGASVEFSIDGVTNQSETGPEHYTWAPPVDSLQEFKITDNAYDAANGRSPGGQIDMTLKTGTRKLHGAAYEYLQRAFLNANTPTNDAGIAVHGPLPAYNKGASTTNQYGFELDGPVLIPKFWHGNKQTFFTILYEDLHNTGIGTSTVSVPTAAMIGQGSQYPGQADFSALLNLTQPAGTPYSQAIYDPMSETACTNNNTDNGSYAKGNPHVCRYQFGYGPGAAPGPQGNPVLIGHPNVIPANRLSPVALAYMSWYPSPNLTPTFSTANPFNSNFVGLPPGSSDNKTYLVKLDQNVGANDSFDITAKLWKFYAQANNAFPRDNVNAAHPGINESVNIAHYNGTDYRYPSLNTSWTHTFSPTLINTIRGLITTALESDSTGPANGYNPTNLGFSATMAAANPDYFNRFPLTNISNYNALGSQTVLFRGDDELQVADTANWTHGNHTIHFGFDIRFQQYSQKTSNGDGITLGIGDAWSQQWDTNVTGGSTGIHDNVGYTNNYSGNSIASMMLGTWDSGSAVAAASNYVSSHYGAAYFQDDWKYSTNLTLNLGVRWEDPGRGVRDRFNRLNSVFDMTDTNPISGMIPASSLAGLPVNSVLLGGPTWAGVNGNPTWEFHHVLYQFGPRAGFAYKVNEKTVIRGGLGLFFNDQATGNQNQPNQYGYGTSTSYTGSSPSALGSATIINPANNMANPFPSFQQATGNCGGNQIACLTTNAGQGLSYDNPNYHPAEVVEESFGIERQLSSKDTIEISYAGTRSYNNATSDDINHINATAQAACDPLRGGNGLNCTQALGSTPAAGTSVGYISNPFYQLAPFAASGSYFTNNSIQKINFTRPYPIFGGITENLINNGKSWYNAIEAVYDHRTAFGLTTHVTYGFSKAMGAGGYADTVNRIPSRTISGTDDPHRLAVSGVYLLPIGQGRRIFPNMPRYLDAAVGGWQTGAIYLFQSGLPMGMSGWIIDTKANGGDLLPRKRFWPGNSNPWYPGLQGTNANNYIQRIKPCVATTDPNTGAIIWTGQSAALVTAGLCSTPNFIKVGSYGATPNVEYSGIRFAPNNQLDMNVSKNFKVVKGMVFQTRLDAFNVLNHIQVTSSGFDTSTSDGFFGIYQMGTSGGSNKSMRFIQINGRLTW